MDNFITHIVSITILLFLLITFLQSGIDKTIDWKGNTSWLKEHFAATFMANIVPLLLAIILVIEVVTAICCIIGIYQLIASNEVYFAVIAMFLACLTLLFLLFGQRVAKDYQGALTITCYFIVAVFGLYVTSNV
ncbi:DoxX family protein [Aquimarina algicola]|uniref:DoxX family protein n=1 Tax=Aquimarina algicola TaxID=2589995 RepID=A0A504JB04_9FLAO|nr:DoxX family protein [Aquimarina algicola]TPN87854.1 DoxX family protein [Aquimarina algicola]